MSNLNVFNQSWNEIVFEGRNKEYGAFQLRQENSKTTLKALFYGTFIIASLVSIPLISNLFVKDLPVVTDTFSDPIRIIDYHPRLPEVKPETEKTEAQPQKSSAKETKYVNTIITDKPTTTTEMPVLDLDKPIKTGAVDNLGDDQGAVTLGQGTLDGTGKKPVDKIVENGGGDGAGAIVGNFGLDSSPEFPGGLKKFSEAFVSKFKTPELSEAMTMKIFVSFVVETDGSLSNIKVARDPGYGLGNEAIRALKAIKTKWKPGVQNGKAVRVSYNLPISVVLKS